MVHTLAPALFLDSLFPVGIRRHRGRRWGGRPHGGQREAAGGRESAWEAEGQPGSPCSGLPSIEGKHVQVLGDKGRDGAEFPGLVCGPRGLFSSVSPSCWSLRLGSRPGCWVLFTFSPAVGTDLGYRT